MEGKSEIQPSKSQILQLPNRMKRTLHHNKNQPLFRISIRNSGILDKDRRLF